MVTRIHLGWNEPFAAVAARWLASQQEELPGMLVIVPTSQAGRQLRHQMASILGAVLSPRITTPGGLLQTDAPDVADDWVEHLAWQSTLESLQEWPSALFPETPTVDDAWSHGFAGELTRLRRTLQENGHTLRSAARKLGSSIEADRWQALAGLESRMESILDRWGYRSRSRVLSQGVTLPAQASRIILAGTTDIPPLLEQALLSGNTPVTTLIGAPASEDFSDTGRPLESWTRTEIPWPVNGGVHLVADTRQQAETAMQLVADRQSPPDEVALGTADAESGDMIQQAFTRAGWTAFHPASVPATTGLKRWLNIWLNWLQDPTLETMVDLLAMPETSALIPNHRATLAERTSYLRDRWMAARPDDLRHRMQHDPTTRESDKETAAHVVRAADTLEQWRTMMLRREFIPPLARLLDTLEPHTAESQHTVDAIRSWIEQAAPLVGMVDRPAVSWLRLMLASLPADTLSPPDGRVIDVQGWLEMPFQPGRHLILCGLNEGLIPASITGDPWLGESAKSFLGLPTNDQRTARDAFILRALIESRREHGHTDLICAKAKSNGEPLMPSRLLLATTPEQLPSRVKTLFASVEPPDAGLRWQRDWPWRPARHATINRFSATAFQDYLACPLRFYLKHVVNMRSSEPQRVEWNQRDFGNVTHTVLERWGLDPDARELGDAGQLSDWLSDELDRVVAGSFGTRVPLAVRIQTESLRQRLGWFATHQTTHHAAGWQVIEVEKSLEIPVDGAVIVTKIDRIDRHRETGDLRIIDYKTGGIGDKNVQQVHRTTVSGSTTFPPHIHPDGPVVYQKSTGKQPKTYRWTNLQLPIYVMAAKLKYDTFATPCYFKVTDSEPQSGIEPWQDFDEEDLDAATACARWVISCVSQGIFGPPAEKVRYDDYEGLLAGRTMTEMFDCSALEQPANQS